MARVEDRRAKFYLTGVPAIAHIKESTAILRAASQDITVFYQAGPLRRLRCISSVF